MAHRSSAHADAEDAKVHPATLIAASCDSSWRICQTDIAEVRHSLPTTYPRHTPTRCGSAALFPTCTSQNRMCATTRAEADGIMFALPCPSWGRPARMHRIATCVEATNEVAVRAPIRPRRLHCLAGAGLLPTRHDTGASSMTSLEGCPRQVRDAGARSRSWAHRRGERWADADEKSQHAAAPQTLPRTAPNPVSVGAARHSTFRLFIHSD